MILFNKDEIVSDECNLENLGCENDKDIKDIDQILAVFDAEDIPLSEKLNKFQELIEEYKTEDDYIRGVVDVEIGGRNFYLSNNLLLNSFMIIARKLYYEQDFEEIYAYGWVNNDLRSVIDGTQYEVGETYKTNDVPTNEIGFHFYTSLDTFTGFDSLVDTKVVEVKAMVPKGSYCKAKKTEEDPIPLDFDGRSGRTHQIKILRVVPSYEFDKDFAMKNLNIKGKEECKSFIEFMNRENESRKTNRAYKGSNNFPYSVNYSPFRVGRWCDEFEKNPYDVFVQFYTTMLDGKLGKEMTNLILSLISKEGIASLESIYLYAIGLPNNMALKEKNDCLNTIISILDFKGASSARQKKDSGYSF